MANEALKRWEAKREPVRKSFNHKRISRKRHLAGRKTFKTREQTAVRNVKKLRFQPEAEMEAKPNKQIFPMRIYDSLWGLIAQLVRAHA